MSLWGRNWASSTDSGTKFLEIPEHEEKTKGTGWGRAKEITDIALLLAEALSQGVDQLGDGFQKVVD